MKRFMVAAAAVLVGGFAWGAPLDLATQQVLCRSAIPEVTAGLLTNEAGAGFIYAEDINGDGTFNENENFLFNGAVASTASSDFLNQAISGFNGAKAFATVQEISSDLGTAVVTFHYGFEIDAYPGLQFALLSVNPKDGTQGSILPLECVEYVATQN